MKIVIEHYVVDMENEELIEYKRLLSEYPEDEFLDLVETDNDGCIKIIHPRKIVSWEILWFFQNLMINQRIRRIERKVGILE